MIVLLPLLVRGYFLWRYLESYESTDDAQVDGHIHLIIARISGYVSDVLVDDEQIVKSGDPLVIIDSGLCCRRSEVRSGRRRRGSHVERFADERSGHFKTTTSTLESTQSALADNQASLVGRGGSGK